MDSREIRGQHIAKTSLIERDKERWIVPSQSRRGTYFVRRDGHDYICSCPDCRFRKHKCKHIWAVEYWEIREMDMDGKENVTQGMRLTYSQNWPAYNKAQSREKAMFMGLLSDLCSGIEQKPYKFGRPNLLLSDMVFCSVFKVFSLYSGRRFSSDMKMAKEYGLITKEPHYNSVFNYLQKPELTPLLKDLITKSSLPLKSVELTFAVDSTGFSTSQYARWFDFRYGREKNVQMWLKAHIMCGVKTNIVTSVEITEGTASDTKQFETLVRKTAENFEIGMVCADKAYSSRANNELVDKLDGTAFIPFRENATKTPKGSRVWRDMYHYYNLHREEFLKRYHNRSNVESTMHMIKAKFGSKIRSKNKIAQVNELLAKVLCHNICVVIQEMHELGIKPSS